jgi:DNA-binding XRE family transcriptional regulator
MITSERQLKTTEAKIGNLKQSVGKTANPKLNPVLQKAGRIQVQALIQELEDEIAEYNSLREKGLKAIKLSSPLDFMLLPIRYRIAKHLSQEEFAKFVGISLRQIARYEAEGYENINGDTLRKILEKMPVKIDGQVLER